MSMFLHVDLDAFFASVEQLDNPDLKGKPVIVGSLPGSKRGVVSTCSYEARKYGVHSAMPTEQAYRLCPNGIYIRPRMKRYHEKSAEVMAIFADFSPDVQQMSVDEAFVDLTGTERLFGPPEQTAMKLKKAVSERTGLTVSVGLAANKYVAKIASGLSKPDGFFYVKPGTEEQFMNSLPLHKVWGVGSKTLARLNKTGFFTVYDVYSATLDLLISIFGQSGGTFLYKAVRGQAAETFSEETKSRSISAENTYPVDLTDRYVIGTALMDLAQTVMFRLIKESWISRTVCVKIRYNDFTTYSVQDTSERIISSADDLYERAQHLFEKKYQTGNGIRLLGIGALNLEPASQPQQKELFDFGEEKKRKLEKTILEIQEKNPEIPIKKARLLKKTFDSIIFCTLLAAAALLNPAPAYADESPVHAEGAAGITLVPVPPLPAEAPVSLFNYTVNDTAVDFFAEGYWESMLTGTMTSTFGFGNPLQVTFGTPVFSQKVDLSMWFMLNRTWYFEAVFADGFEKNTVAAGYTGTGILKEARIANRNIVFPQTYPAEKIQRGIGGGENQAPGLSISLAGTKWSADAALRYDMLAAHEKTYSGRSEVTDSQIHLASWERTSLFVLPSQQTAADIADVFIESASGTYTAADGRTYRKLSSSEYLLYPAQAQLELTGKSGLLSADGDIPVIAVSFTTPAAAALTEDELGNYGTAEIPGSKFLGKIQAFFGSAYDTELPDGKRAKPAVASYSFAGKSGTGTEGFFVSVKEGSAPPVQVLLLQHPAGFSPFSAAYRYNAGKNEPETVSVVSASTGTVSKTYAASLAEHTDAYGGTCYTAELYRMQNAPAGNGPLQVLEPAVRFPAADAHPEYYLLPPEAQSPPPYGAADPVLKLQTFTQTSQYEIGTKAVPGTIRVYKNGIADEGARYDSETGVITLSVSAGDFDTVRITWYEENGETQTGTVSAGAGFEYRFTDTLSAAASVTTRWPYSQNMQFADARTPLPGFAAAAAGITYESSMLSVQNTAAASVETDNASGIYRVLGMDDSILSEIPLAKKAASNLNENTIPVLSAAGAPVLSAQDRVSIPDAEGIRDTGISGYAAVYDYRFDAQDQWAARTIDLGNAAAQLASAERFSIKLKNIGAAPAQYDVYLQLGIDAEAQTEFDPDTIPSWRISGADIAGGGTNVVRAFVPGKDGWQTAAVRITEPDRARLAVHNGARIIIVARSGNNIQGTLLAGPYEIVNPAFTAQSPPDIQTYASQYKENVSGTELFNTGSANSVQSFQWKWTDSLPSEDDIAFTRYIAETDISKYRTLNLFMKYNPAGTAENTENTSIDLIFDRPVSDSAAVPETALRITLSSQAVTQLKDWKLVTADLNSGEVKIGGTVQPGCTVVRGSSDVPVRFTVLIHADNPGNTNWSSLLIDELYFKDMSPDIVLTDTAEFTWKHEGPLLSAGSFAILSDTSVTVSGTASLSIPAEYPERMKKSLSGKIESKADIAGIGTRFDAAADASQHNSITAAGHSLISKNDSPVFKYMPFSEIYRFDASSHTLKKQNSLVLTLKPLQIPAELGAYAESSATQAQQMQKITGKAAFTIPFGSSVSYAVSADASAVQKINPGTDGAPQADTNSYARGWLDSTVLAFSPGSGSASYRKIMLAADQSLALPFASFAPVFAGSISGTYSVSAETAFTDETVTEWIFPFKPGRHSVSLSWKKTAGSTAASDYGGNYLSDSEKLMQALSINKELIAAPPFYDLFSSDIPEAVLDSAARSGNASASYTTSYGITWKRPFAGTFADFYTPSNMYAAFGREIKAAENYADIYVVKAGTGFTSFNNFGAYSKLHLFDWYEQDEYIFSASAAAQIPHEDPESFAVKLASYFQVNLYFASGAALKTGAEIQFEKDSLLIGKLTAVWQRQGKMSPVTAAVKLFVPPESLPPMKMTRSDSLNCTVNRTQTESSRNIACTVTAEHKLDIQIGQYVSVIVTLSGSCSYSGTKDTQLLRLGAAAGVGGKIIF